MKTILYIDDEAALPGGFTTTAGDLGFRIVHAESIGSAEQALRDQPPELVIIEPLLAEGGWELLERLAAQRRNAIVLTRGDRGPRVYGRALDLGIREFLCKPALRAELLECVLEIESRGARAPASESPPGEIAPSAASAPEAARASPQTGGSARLGVLASAGLIELLAELHRSGASGVLRVECSDDSLGIELRNGSIVARSRTEEERFEEFLARTGRITGRDRERVLDFVELGQASVRDALIDHCFLTESEVEDALRERAEERLWAALAWADGTYRFQADDALDPRSSLEIERETGWLLYEAVQKAPDGRRFAAWLRSQRDHVVVPVPDRRGRFAGRLEKNEGQDVLEAISEERTVGDLLASGAIGERTLFGLVFAGWAECLAEIEVIDSEEVAQSVASEATMVANPAGAVVESVESSHAIALRSTQLAVAAQDERTAAERALEGESWFRKGKALLESKRSREAAEAFGMASHLDPEDGEYAAHLGYSLYLTNPADSTVERESLEHIARGIKRSPTRELSYVFLGRIFKAKGDFEMAGKVFRRALKIRPDCHPARQELRLLDLRDSKKSSLLGRLFEK